MNTLRRAIGRKEVVLGMLLSVLGVGWFGWHELIRPALAQGPAPTDAAEQIKTLLHAGQYSQAISEANAALAVAPNQPTVLRYMAIAQLLTNDQIGALQAADTASSGGANGSDLAALLAVKALVLVSDEQQQVAAAKQAALQAVPLAGADEEAVLLANLAGAAVSRCELDLAGTSVALPEQAIQIAQALEPLFGAGAVEPQAAWASKLWRRGLALLAESGFLATDGGAAGGEATSLALLQRLCPEDAWNCYFGIPKQALAAVRAGTLDDHARVALLTAIGFLYLQSADRLHCDVMYRRAIQVYGRLLHCALPTPEKSPALRTRDSN